LSSTFRSDSGAGSPSTITATATSVRCFAPALAALMPASAMATPRARTGLQAVWLLRGALVGIALGVAAGQPPDCGGRADGALGRASGAYDAAAFSVCVKSRNAPSLVFFRSSRCGTCGAFQPTWEALAGALAGGLRGDLRLGGVNVDEAGGMPLAAAEGALEAGLPAVFFYPGGGRPPLPIPILDAAAGDDDDGAFLSLESIAEDVRARCREPPPPPDEQGAADPAPGEPALAAPDWAAGEPPGARTMWPGRRLAAFLFMLGAPLSFLVHLFGLGRRGLQAATCEKWFCEP